MTADFEVVLPLRVVPQPEPHINPGGDCGGCVCAGLLGLSVAEVYARYAPERCDSAIKVRQLLWDAQAEGLLDRVVTEHPIWPDPFFDVSGAYGLRSTQQAQAWWNYVRMGIDAGYYVLANVCFEKTGGDTNHWVLIVGVRSIGPGPQGGRIRQELLVSCSSKSTPDEEWVDLHDFLTQRGGFNCMLARPVGALRREHEASHDLGGFAGKARP